MISPDLDSVLKLVLAFAKEALSGEYPKKANAQAHHQSDAINAERIGVDAATFRKSLTPPGIIPRVMRLVANLHCPPMDSRNPSRLVELEDYLACHTPLVDGLIWTEEARQGGVNDSFCAALVEAIERETPWQSVELHVPSPTPEDYKNGTALLELAASIHAIFENDANRALIAIMRERTSGFGKQELSLGIAFIPESERAAMDRFLT